VEQPSLPLLAVKVIAVRDEAPNVRSFELAAAEDDGLPPFTPGSHIDVHCAPGIVRQYSLVNGPGDTAAYHIAVRRDPASRGGSAALHGDVGEGDLLTISAPRNHFPLAPNASHHLLIAGGIGITPILSMARHLEAGGASWSLHYFVRSTATAAYTELLTAGPFAGKVTIHEGVDPQNYDKALLPIIGTYRAGAHLYHCGGRSFMAAVEAAATAREWPPEAVRHEYFAADPAAWSAPREPFEIELARSGRVIHVAADRSIIEALAESGIPAMTSCEQGVCGTCLVKVVRGEVDHRDAFLSEAERRQGDSIMICVSRAQGSRITLDL
jgi:vanillate O-demethylase ferredoxin subunit